MAEKITTAEEVQEIAQKLIPEFHPHLQNVKIEYVFNPKVPKHGKREVWGTMRKVSGLTAYLAADKFERSQGEYQDFFVMTISKPIWEDLEMGKKEALVDHELMHAGVGKDKDGNPKLKLVPHDLEEFVDIVQRHGLWMEDIKKFRDAMRLARKEAE